jgi:LuxR family transcriptional regulator, quorum-sensing system regulator ExpR
MFSAFEQNHTITETLKEYIDRKMRPLGSPYHLTGSTPAA